MLPKLEVWRMPHDDLSSTTVVPGHVASTDLFGDTAAEAMERSATLSACRTYRYALWRRWGVATTPCSSG